MAEEDEWPMGGGEGERVLVGEGELDGCCITVEKVEIFLSQFHNLAVGEHCFFNLVLLSRKPVTCLPSLPPSMTTHGHTSRLGTCFLLVSSNF